MSEATCTFLICHDYFQFYDIFVLAIKRGSAFFNKSYDSKIDTRQFLKSLVIFLAVSNIKASYMLWLGYAELVLDSEISLNFVNISYST